MISRKGVSALLLIALLLSAGCAGVMQSGSPKTTTEAGASTGPEFRVENITYPDQVQTGETAHINITVTNIGDEAGVYNDAFMTKTGIGWVVVHEPQTAVDPGETWTWQVWYRLDDSGVQTFRIFNAETQFSIRWTDN